MDAQVRHLAQNFRVVATTAAGSALRPFDPAAAYTHAGDLIALLDHLRIGQAVLAGLSFGGRVVMQAALAAPHRVRGLVLLDAVLDGVPGDPDSAEALDEAARQAQAFGMLAGRAAWLAHCSRAARERRRSRASWPRWSAVTRAALDGPRPPPADPAEAHRALEDR